MVGLNLSNIKAWISNQEVTVTTLYSGHRENVESDNCTDIIRRRLAESKHMHPKGTKIGEHK